MAAAQMILRTIYTSPFGRKVRIAAEVLGLTDSVTIEPADTLDVADTLREQNPLGKMPCLILADETVLFDSRVIIEFLDSLSDQSDLVPKNGLERYRALTRAALCDGITDAAVLIVYESRFREPSLKSERWLSHQRGKIFRGLAAAEQNPPDPTVTDIISIGLACALDYLDWRKPVEWRLRHPALAGWLDEFAGHEPAFSATRRPEE